MRSLRAMLWFAAALAAIPAAAQSTGCLEGELLIAPATVCAGDTVSVSASLTNCGERRDLVRVSLEVEGLFLASGRMPLAPDATRSFDRSIPLPPGFPERTFTFTLRAESKHGGAEVVESQTLTIVHCD